MANPETDPELKTGPDPEDDSLIIDQGLTDDILELIADRDQGSLMNLLVDLHDSDIAVILDHLPPDDAIYLFRLLQDEQAAAVLLDVNDHTRGVILDSLGNVEITNIIDELDSDDAADVIQELPEEVAEVVLESISEEDRSEVRELLSYEEDTAGGLMATELIRIHESSSIYDAIMEIKKQAEEVEDLYDLYVVDAGERLVGTIDLKTLIITPSYKKVSEVMDTGFLTVRVDMDQEEVAHVMQKHDLVSIGVVNDQDQIVGQITIDDIVDVIRDEAQEDIQRLTGVVEESFSSRILKIVGSRLPWLLIGLFGEMISGMVIRSFESTLSQMIVLYAFIPLIMAMGGSTGVQSSSIVIQAIARGELWMSDIWKRLGKELGAALLISFTCGLIVVVVSMLTGGSLDMGLTIGGALMVVMVNAAMMGTVLPLMFEKLNVDPAMATGPFITTLNDILGLTIYFSIAYVVFF
ncbi:MAG: magnesium transporter [Bacteroidetes bacterium]|nr:magnesium transporter [Bacteroidota bacterium]